MEDRRQILLDYEQAKRKADELDRIADELGRLSEGEFADTLNDLGNSWNGGHAQTYIRKGLNLKEKMKQMAEELRASAYTIRASAKHIRDMEPEAVEIVKERAGDA